MSLAAELLMLSGLSANPVSARIKLEKTLESGMAAERFARMVSMQGGPSDLMEHPQKYLKSASVTRVLEAPRHGFISHMETRAIGLCVVGLGGGRRRAEDAIDHSVGLSDFALIGTKISLGDPLVTIHANDESSWRAASEILLDAISIGRKTDALPAVYEHIS